MDKGSTMTSCAKYSKSDTVLCLIVVILICFTGIVGHDLWTPDEPRVAAASLAMSRTGDVVIPSLAGTPFVEKPPLYFAFSALMIKVFGPLFGNVGAVRLGSAFLGLGVLLLTFLIGRHLGGQRVGVLSAVFLACMEGFVENFHWIRVDAALAFFVAGSVYCLLKVFREDRYAYAPWAGICIAGSFLAKGLVGPVLTAIPWFILFLERIILRKRENVRLPRFFMQNILILLFVSAFCALWIIPFYFKGGASLWHEWFWVNHIERFTGAAAAKGHVILGNPFYYVEYLISYAFPWTPLVFLWFVYVIRKAVGKRHVDPDTWFLLSWGVLTLILLTNAATKRAIYLLPVLPAYAIMAALGICSGTPKWFGILGKFWVCLSLFLISLFTFCPLFTRIFPSKIPSGVLTALSRFGAYQVLSFTGLVACLVLIFRYRKRLKPETILIFVTGVLYMTLLGMPVSAIDREKSMEKDIKAFVSRIPETDRGRVAGVDLNETTLGCLYFYGGMDIPQVTDREKIEDILGGRDDRFDSLILNTRHRKGKEDRPPIDLPCRIIEKTITGGNRVLYLIEGDKKTTAGFREDTDNTQHFSGQ